MAEKSEIIDEIEALTVHCRPPPMEAGSRAGWLRDWCEDLAKFPIEAIRLGIRDWRHGGGAKFPTVGQLLPLVRAKNPAEIGFKPEPWRDLPEGEYQQLSIREKIRHQKILAHEAAIKAGPMWRNQGTVASFAKPVDGRVSADDMPGTFHHWKAIEAGHYAEARRLADIIRDREAAQ